jgi:hypothetical protein
VEREHGSTAKVNRIRVYPRPHRMGCCTSVFIKIAQFRFCIFILKTVMRKSKLSGVHFFSLTGIPGLDRFWRTFFRRSTYRHRVQYNGFLFRIIEEDFPARFGHCGARSVYSSLAELESAYRDTIMYHIAERFGGPVFDELYSDAKTPEEADELIRSTFNQICEADPGVYNRVLANSPGSMEFIFEDYEIVLSQSIAPGPIFKVIPGGGQSGRQIARKRKEGGD